jgi:hypothetical protein
MRMHRRVEVARPGDVPLALGSSSVHTAQRVGRSHHRREPSRPRPARWPPGPAAPRPGCAATRVDSASSGAGTLLGLAVHPEAPRLADPRQHRHGHLVLERRRRGWWVVHERVGETVLERHAREPTPSRAPHRPRWAGWSRGDDAPRHRSQPRAEPPSSWRRSSPAGHSPVAPARPEAGWARAEEEEEEE